MALTKVRKAELAQMDVPGDAIMRARLDDFLAKSGYTDQELADALHIGRSSLSIFRGGNYSRHHLTEDSTLNFRARLKEFLESHPLARQFRDAGQLYRTRSYAELRKAFYAAVDHPEHAYCVDGPPGTQKTHILEALVNELQAADAAKNGHGRRAYYIYCPGNISPLYLMKRIAIEAGVPSRGQIDQVVRKLQFHFATRRVVLVLDEAQHLSKGALERLRELLDRPPYFGLIFAGSDDVGQKFEALDMAQWKRRLKKRIQLRGLNEDEVRDIVIGDTGSCSAAKLALLVKRATVRDFRKRADDPQATYLSAGELFSALKERQRKRDGADSEVA